MSEYKECLELDSAKLERLDRLLFQDFTKWQKASAESKLLIQRIKGQVDEMIRKEEERLREEAERRRNPLRHVYAPPETKYQLKRLDAFGEQVHERNIQFDWPTNKIFSLMRDVDNLRLTSLTIQANKQRQIVGVQCKLSNGLESSFFKSLIADSDDQLVTKTLDFEDEQRLVRSIEARDDGYSQVFSLSFKDESGEDIASFGTDEEPQPNQTLQTRSVSRLHRVVGVYGIKDEARHITSLGFLIKVA